jgi:hypothetical protein
MKSGKINNILTNVGLLIAIFLIAAACERREPIDLGEFNCSECFEDEPEWGSLIVYVTINGENPRVPLVVYIGDIEEGNIDWYDTATSKEYYVPVRPDAYYSVVAKYKRGDQTILAVDGDKFKLEYTDKQCDTPCYYFKGGYIDVRLRD